MIDYHLLVKNTTPFILTYFAPSKYVRFFCLIVFLAVAAPVFSQKGLSIESIFHYGKVVKHRDILGFEVTEPSFGTEIGFRFQTFGTQSWHYWQNYPLLGGSLLYYYFGNHATLGSAVAAYPSLHFYLFRRTRFDVQCQVGTGIAYLTKPFNAVTNPNNNAIGSTFTNITALRMGARWTFATRWAAQAGGSLTHFSNGASQLPNLGLNITALYIGLQYSPSPLQKPDYQVPTESSTPPHRFGLMLHADLAFVEDKIPGGPKYPIYIASLGGVYHLSKVNRLILGAEYEWNSSIYAFNQHISPAGNEAASRRLAVRTMVFLADEWLFGNWSILLQAGTYFGANRRDNFFIYNKLNVRYYLPAFGTPKTRFFMGVYLKSHRAIAEYIALGGGATF